MGILLFYSWGPQIFVQGTVHVLAANNSDINKLIRVFRNHWNKVLSRQRLLT